MKFRFQTSLIVGLLGLLFIISSSSLWALSSSDNFQIESDVISGGGIETGSSANFQLQDTIGEAIIRSATSTSDNFGTKAGFRELYADQFVTLTAGAATVNLGTLSDSSTESASHTLVVQSNASQGMILTAAGDTLTSGANTITAIGDTAAAASVGSEQFGINLVANTTPSIGANLSGTSPIISVADQYNTADLFAFDDGGSQVVATSTAPINETTLTVSYIANITDTTEAGTYSTTITYSATASF